jgi:hypothetical protein
LGDDPSFSENYEEAFVSTFGKKQVEYEDFKRGLHSL